MIRDFLSTLETRVLLTHVTGRNRAWLLSHAEERLTPEQEKALEMALTQLQNGVPLPYIIGHWEFYGLDFLVTPDVLIPRPETELLVEFALNWAKKGDPLGRPYRFIDVGTGSGIIPVTLATRLPTAQFLATDLSPAALKVARANAERHHVAERIRFVECDLLPDKVGSQKLEVRSQNAPNPQSSIENRKSSIVTANLPYIPTETMKGLPIFGKEPTIALDGGADGLELIRRLLARLTADKLAWQVVNGKLPIENRKSSIVNRQVSLVLLEIETRQGNAVSALAREAFPQADIHLKKDLAGHDRLVTIETGE